MRTRRYVLNAASVRQPLAEAATRPRVDREVARIMEKVWRRIPTSRDPIGERGVTSRRCVIAARVSYEKAGGGAFNHLARKVAQRGSRKGSPGSQYSIASFGSL